MIKRYWHMADLEKGVVSVTDIENLLDKYLDENKDNYRIKNILEMIKQEIASPTDNTHKPQSSCLGCIHYTISDSCMEGMDVGNEECESYTQDD